MKIKIYTKNEDIEYVTKHIKKFLIKYSKDKKNQIELRKCSKIDSNYYRFDMKYQQIVIFYTNAILVEKLLRHIYKLSTAIIDIVLVIRYLKDNIAFDNETHITIDNHADILDFIEVANYSIGK